mmetsp:Transcript_65677/g.156980  ORF Transcript_65677/g.156980 Transcript_65677/m.156980 type:complete len:275 (+) Transcript_65677:46-870(+)
MFDRGVNHSWMSSEDAGRRTPCQSHSSKNASLKKSGGASGLPSSTPAKVSSSNASQAASVRAILSALPFLSDFPDFLSGFLFAMSPLALLSSSAKAAMMASISCSTSLLPVVSQMVAFCPMMCPRRPPWRLPPRFCRLASSAAAAASASAFFRSSSFLFSASASSTPCTVQDMILGTAHVPSSVSIAAVQMSGHQWFATVSMRTYFCLTVSTYSRTLAACAVIPLRSRVTAKFKASCALLKCADVWYVRILAQWLSVNRNFARKAYIPKEHDVE